MMTAFSELPWNIIAILSISGIGMALVSSLVGMKQKVEIPMWWGLYAVWVVIVLVLDIGSPFLTILVSSILAGVLHGCTQGLLIKQYARNNPWHADKMQGPQGKIAAMFVVMGVGVGMVFGAVVGGIAWGLSLV